MCKWTATQIDKRLCLPGLRALCKDPLHVKQSHMQQLHRHAQAVVAHFSALWPTIKAVYSEQTWLWASTGCAVREELQEGLKYCLNVACFLMCSFKVQKLYYTMFLKMQPKHLQQYASAILKYQRCKLVLVLSGCRYITATSDCEGVCVQTSWTVKLLLKVV